MDSVMLLQRVVDETTEVVNDVSEDQLGNPSPCEGWTVRDVINHITGGATMFAISAEQGSVPDDELGRLMGGDNLGDDPQGAWAKAAARAMQRVRAARCARQDRQAAVRRDARRASRSTSRCSTSSRTRSTSRVPAGSR